MVVSRVVDALRFGVTYEPPVLALEFSEARGDLLVLQMNLPTARRENANADEIVENLLLSHQRYLNVATISVQQVRRLVQMVVDYHAAKRGKRELPPLLLLEEEAKKPPPEAEEEEDSTPNAAAAAAAAAEKEVDEATAKRRAEVASKFQYAVARLKEQTKRNSLVSQLSKKLHAESARYFAACLPCFVASQIVEARLRGERVFRPKPEMVDGAVFFADISGFTKLTEKLSRHLDGAERLCAELDVVYGMILEEADALGGDAIKFAGDAILFLFAGPLESACRRAASCSARAHERIKQHPPVESVKLTLHAGLGAGKVAALSVEGTNRAEFVIAGAPLAEIGIAEPLAGPGETVASPTAWSFLKDIQEGSMPLTKVKELPAEAQGYVKLGAFTTTTSPYDDTKKEEPRLSESISSKLKQGDVAAMAPYVPLAFQRTLRNKQALTNFLESGAKAEIRELTVAFLKISGVDLGDLSRVESSRKMMACVNSVVATRFGGSINKLLVDDKGTLMVLVFGLPGEVHEDSPLRAVCAAMALQAELKSTIGASCWAGLTTAATFAGVVGSRARMEYTVMGDSVNLAARLMAACCASFGASEGANALVVSERTAEKSRYEIEYHAMAPIKVKGKANKVRVYIPKAIRVKVPRPALDLRFKTRADKKKQLDDVLRRYARQFYKIKPPTPTRKTSSHPQPPARCCVIAGVHGADVNFVFGSVFADLCPKHNLERLHSFRSRSTFHDAELKAQTTCGAWRGPVVRAIQIIAGKTNGGDDDFYPPNVRARGPYGGSGSEEEEEEEKKFFSQQTTPQEVAAFEWISAQEARALAEALPDPLKPRLGLLDDLFLGDHSFFSREMADIDSKKREAYVVQLVTTIVALAAAKKPCVVILDNEHHMDAASWLVVHHLHDWAKRGGPSSLTPPPSSRNNDTHGLLYVEKGIAPLLCLRLPVIANKNQVVYLQARRAAESRNALVQVGALDESEALEFTAFALGIQEEDAGVVRDNDDLVEFAKQADGKQRLLSDMLVEARKKRMIEVRRDSTVDALAPPSIEVHGDLASLPAPARYKALLLAQIDVDLPVHKQILARAAAVFRTSFSPAMLLALAPFQMDERHVRDDLHQLCDPLPSSGLTLFVRAAEKPPFHRDLPFAADADLYYEFAEPLARTAVADTLLESHVQHVIAKINALPAAAAPAEHNTAVTSWELELVHPYILARRRRWERTAKVLRGFLNMARNMKAIQGIHKK
ncbi:hypothetical protein CTAYLR_003031 [Chrysophaeum taylorii]|uniref:Guanylate cyclase domain-containing protein n=1 Tax=Chrysophaeum taylorii TaxID=2483200 RepID=A0AAD7U534_9STRA|nr:hypothetical protein CTAYLR_003031 [Chrysophaeum taylorii]